MYRYLVILSVLLLCAAVLAAGPYDDDQSAQPSKERLLQSQQALDALSSSRPNLKAYKTGSVVTRLYGQSFGGGVTAQAAADAFVAQEAAVFGIDTKDLVSGSLVNRGIASQPVMYDQETGTYKFDLVHYRQVIDGIPVFQAELRLLARNMADHSLVLAVSTLKDLDGFQVDASKAGYSFLAEQVIRSDESDLTDFSEQETVIFAGDADKWDTPRMAASLIASSGFPQKFLYVIDINTGEILYKEDMIVFEDVTGSVGGNATPGPKAMQCTSSIFHTFPYAWVQIIGGNGVFADQHGDFTIPNSGSSDVEVVSMLSGEYFEVFNYSGAEVAETLLVTPPGPADFVHNSLDNQEHIRAQMNGYANANEVHDWILIYNPTYPTISTQTDFPVYVNRTDGYCPGNAWYDGGSINFCESSVDYGNTSFASVSQHEYGHHLVASGGSGQGEYGEGMSDCVAMLISDDPGLGYGFYFDQCNTPLRNADNDLQYPCSGGIHYCGQVLSGSVWDTRTELGLSGDSAATLAIISNLAVNAVLLHTGTSITPQITIDYLTLDDDDGNLGNGTPHYYEIATGFGNHNLDAPALALLTYSYPSGLPSLLNPNVATTFEVVITSQESDPVSGTGMLYLAIDGGGFSSSAMTETSTNHYEATIPALDCFQSVEFYFSCEEIGGATVYDPEPGSYYDVLVATDEAIAFFDGFEVDLGWSGGGDWERGAATAGGGEHGYPDPGYAFFGTNVLGYYLGGDYENSMSETHVTSPAIDCSEVVGSTLRFYRWLGVEQSLYDHAYVRVSNNGSTWTTIWENGSTIEDNSWTQYEYDISGVADDQTTVYIRFTMGTTDGSWQYCGWNIDDVQVVGYVCYESSPSITTETLPDWTAGVLYSQQLEATGGTGALTWTDRDDDLIGTGLSLSGTGLLSGTIAAAGPISFTARVTDEVMATDDQLLAFTVNPEVAITTTDLPDGTIGEFYYYELQATGGTGLVSWTDKYGDLDDTGIALLPTGVLDGAALDTGVISFTAEITDEVGSIDEQGFSIYIAPAFLCGDIDDDGDGPDVEDLIYLVNFMFQEGPAPPFMGSTDVNGDGEGPDIEDLIYLVQFMFQDGPDLICE